jgi:hypothetical protein
MAPGPPQKMPCSSNLKEMGGIIFIEMGRKKIPTNFDQSLMESVKEIVKTFSYWGRWLEVSLEIFIPVHR